MKWVLSPGIVGQRILNTPISAPAQTFTTAMQQKGDSPKPLPNTSRRKYHGGYRRHLPLAVIFGSDPPGFTSHLVFGLKQLVATDAAVQWHYVMAGTVLAALPPLIVLVILQRSLIEGMSLYEEK